MTDLAKHEKVENEIDFFMDEFATFDQVDKWDLISTGANVLINAQGYVAP